MGAAKAVIVSDDVAARHRRARHRQGVGRGHQARDPDLVLAATESSDGYTGTTPVQLAELLGLPSITFAKSVTIDGVDRQGRAPDRVGLRRSDARPCRRSSPSPPASSNRATPPSRASWPPSPSPLEVLECRRPLSRWPGRAGRRAPRDHRRRGRRVARRRREVRRRGRRRREDRRASSNQSKSSRRSPWHCQHLGRRRAVERFVHDHLARTAQARAHLWRAGLGHHVGRRRRHSPPLAGDYGATTLYDVGDARRRAAGRARRVGDRGARRERAARPTRS